MDLTAILQEQATYYHKIGKWLALGAVYTEHSQTGEKAKSYQVK